MSIQSAIDELSIEYLKECFHYDPSEGVFRWKVRPIEHFRTPKGWKIFNTTYAGKIAGCPNVNGYIQLVISRKEIIGKHLLAHRAAWAFIHGVWPPDQIDHVDGNPSNNRLSNLRPATNSDNNCNMNTPKHNTSGVKGVRFHAEVKKWCAEIGYKKVTYRLGFFETKEKAVEAIRCKRIRLHGEFANHGKGHPQLQFA